MFPLSQLSQLSILSPSGVLQPTLALARDLSSGSSCEGPVPVISVGVPVYNGARFLSRAIDSLLGQSFTDLELIISDNASTDSTREICERYAQRDPRVRYFRQPANIGAPENWNFVVRQARGRFFKWASANDYCDGDMLAKCAAVLDADRRMVLCYGRTRLIDDADRPVELYDGDLSVLDERPSERYGKVRRCLGLNNAQMGLIRMDVLRHTRLERKYPAGDMVLMAELTLLGPFALLPDVLFYRRMSKEAASRFLSRAELQQFIDPTARGTMNHWRLQWDYIAVVARAPIAFREKWRCFRVTARHAYWDGPELWKDLRALFAKQAA
jgi:glycosyltransferase involved in cell wall biosynthesis